MGGSDPVSLFSATQEFQRESKRFARETREKTRKKKKSFFAFFRVFRGQLIFKLETHSDELSFRLTNIGVGLGPGGALKVFLAE